MFAPDPERDAAADKAEQDAIAKVEQDYRDKALRKVVEAAPNLQERDIQQAIAIGEDAKGQTRVKDLEARDDQCRDRTAYRPPGPSVLRSANWSLRGVRMRRVATSLVLAVLLGSLSLLVGFLSYRAAIATMPSDQMWTWGRQPYPCPGTVVDAHFDPVTGFLVSPTCTFSDGTTLTDGYMYLPSYDAVEHYYLSALFGLAVVPLAFIALWWRGRRRRGHLACG